jgi:hypothetical protein
MDTTIETYGTAVRAVREWVEELESNDRHERADIVAGTVLFWAVSLDDALEARHAGYRDAARASETGSVMLGLRFARNAVTHGFALCVRQRGMEFPVVYPVDYGPMVWERAERFLGRWTPKGREVNIAEQVGIYRERMERRPVHEPLRGALAWLEEWRSVSAL